MNRGWKTAAIVAAGGGIVYYLYHRHEAAASNALTQDIANGNVAGQPTMTSPLGDTGAMTDPYALPNAGTPTYGTGAVGNGTPPAPNTQPVVKTPTTTPPPASTPQPVGPAKGIITIPGQTPPIVRLPASFPQPMPSPVIVHNPQTPPIMRLPASSTLPVVKTPILAATPQTSKVTTYMKG